MTKKEYVVAVAQQIAENPKGCLAGHGINGAIMNVIAERPDVMAKIATLAYSTVNNKKGGKGLKKASNFKISAYKTFGEFADNAATDVETFMEGLSEEDQQNFTNADNISVIIVGADKPTENFEADIANLQSVIVPFDAYSKKAYKFNGIYITMMYGDSLILSKDAKVAEVKAVVNKKIVARKNPSRVRAELAAKAKAKLATIKGQAKNLGFNARKTAAELEEFDAIRNTFGVAENARQKTVLDSIANYTKETKAYINSLSRKDKKYWKAAADAKAEGKIKLMIANLSEVSPENNARVTEIVRGGNLTTGDAMLEARRKQFKLKIAEITKSNEKLLAAAADAPNAKTRGNINFKIRANIEQIKLLKAKIAVHGQLAPGILKNKLALLKQTQAAIEENRLKGLSVSQALAAAVAKLPVDAQTKQQVKQQVIEQMAAGTGLQLAVQQTIQQLPVATGNVVDIEDEFVDNEFEDVFVDEGISAALGNSATIADLLEML